MVDSSEADASVALGTGISISRRGREVSVILTAAIEYKAIELYEHLVSAAQDGRFSLEAKVNHNSV